MSDWKGYHFRSPGGSTSTIIGFYYTALKTFLEMQGWAKVDEYDLTRTRLRLYGSNYFPNDSTVTIDGKTYKFKDTLTPAEGEVWKGANITESFANLKLAVNREAPETNNGVKYQIAEAHPIWEGTTVNGSELYFEARVWGAHTDGNPATSLLNTNWFGWTGIEVWGREAKTVWRSNGESGKEPYGYIWIFPHETTLYFEAYQYWNEVAHTGTRRNYRGGEMTMDTFSASYDCMISGDKDFICLSNEMGYTQGYARRGVIFGHIAKRCYPDIINTTGPITAGDNVTIPVTDSSKVPGKGGYFQIVGASGEGCDRLQVVSLPDATSVKVTNVPRNYASGAFIGQPASTFFLSQWYTGQGDQYYRPVSYPTDAGLNVSANSFWVNNIGLSANDSFTGKAAMTPLYFMINGQPLLGYFDKGIFFFTGPAHYDVICINNDLSMITENILATGSTNLSVTDSTKSWTPNEFLGKFIILVGGTGIFQVRKITGNTDDTIEIDYPWYINPDGTTTFRIYDTIYRYNQCFPFGTSVCHLITHTGVPVLPA